MRSHSVFTLAVIGLFNCGVIFSERALASDSTQASTQASASICQPFIGTSKELKTGKLVFIEHYNPDCSDPSRKKMTITINGSDGKPLAKQQSNQSWAAYLFETDFKDLRDGYNYQISLSASKDTKREVRITQRQSAGAAAESKSIPFEPDFLNLSGAMTFIQDHLQELGKGKELIAKFVVPSRMDAYSVHFIPEKTKDQNRLIIAIQMTNPFYRVFAPEMRFTFDVTTKKPTQFYGNAILLDSQDRPIRVETNFHTE